MEEETLKEDVLSIAGSLLSEQTGDGADKALKLTQRPDLVLAPKLRLRK